MAYGLKASSCHPFILINFFFHLDYSSTDINSCIVNILKSSFSHEEWVFLSLFVLQKYTTFHF